MPTLVLMLMLSGCGGSNGDDATTTTAAAAAPPAASPAASVSAGAGGVASPSQPASSAGSATAGGEGVKAPTALPQQVHVDASAPAGGQLGTADKPLSSLSDALSRLATEVNGDASGRELVLAAGTYYLDDTLVLDARLSGKPGKPFVIRAAAGAQPVISGARRVTLDWTPGTDGTWRAPLPAPDGLAIDGLTVNGEQQVRARYPNFDPDTTKGGKFFNGYSASATSAERIARWGNPAGGYLHAMQGALWGDLHFEIKGKKADGTLDLGPGLGNNRANQLIQAHADVRYVENIFEELDAPKEWFHDVKTGTLYWRPAAGVDPRNASVEVSRLEGLLRFVGTESAPVHDIAMRGLMLTQTRQTFLKTLEPLLRSDWKIYRGGAVYLEGTRNIELSGNDFKRLGGNAVFVSGYNRGALIRGNEFFQIGASAVAFVGKPEAVRNPLFEYGQRLPIAQIDLTPGPKTNDYPAQSSVENNLIHMVGRFEKQSAGVQISMASEITVRSNSIYDVPRAGINISEGTWGGHLIEFNDVFRTVLETGDHGAFNSWGRDRFWSPDRGTMNRINADNPALAFLDVVKPITLRNNRFRCDHGWDIDLDDGSSNYIIENNVLLNRGLKNREGFKRINRNNIVINSSFQPHAWFENSLDRVERNILMANYGAVFMPTTAPWGELIDNNFFTSQAVLRNAQELGLDANSSYGNPGFLDVAKGDYRVAANSPALKEGFVNFPMDRFGVQDSRLKPLAETPVLPKIGVTDIVMEAPSLFAGASVKSVQTDGEQSAVGLPTIGGVLVLDVPSGTDAARAGLVAGDGITKAVVKGVTTVIRTVNDLTAATKTETPNGRLNLTVMHNQVEVPVVVVFTLP